MKLLCLGLVLALLSVVCTGQQQTQLQQALLLSLQRNPQLLAQIRSNPALLTPLLQRSLAAGRSTATSSGGLSGLSTSLQRGRISRHCDRRHSLH